MSSAPGENRCWVRMNRIRHARTLYLKGPDALRLLERVSYRRPRQLHARQSQAVYCLHTAWIRYCPCVAYCLEPNSFLLSVACRSLNWVQYQAETGGYNVTIERDDPTPFDPKGKKNNYRFQLEGPPPGKIFNRRCRRRSARDSLLPHCPREDARTRRHGPAARNGRSYGSRSFRSLRGDASCSLRHCRRRCQKYGIKLHGGAEPCTFRTIFEFGWMPYPLPGIYTNKELRQNSREWLSSNGWEA